jgi:hypothetical protein
METWWWLRCKWNRHVLIPAWKERRKLDPPLWALWPFMFFERGYWRAYRQVYRALQEKT